jgi:hypothetical protein
MLSKGIDNKNMNEMLSTNDMSHLIQLLCINVLSHRPLKKLRIDAQRAVQNVEHVVQDRHVKHGP